MINETVSLESKRKPDTEYTIEFENATVRIKTFTVDHDSVRVYIPLADLEQLARISECRRIKNKAIAEYDAMLEGYE